MPQVRIESDSFVIGSRRVPRGTIIETSQRAIDYMVLRGTGVPVTREPEPPVPRQPESRESVAESTSAAATHPRQRKPRQYKRRDIKAED